MGVKVWVCCLGGCLYGSVKVCGCVKVFGFESVCVGGCLCGCVKVFGSESVCVGGYLCGCVKVWGWVAVCVGV